MMNILALDLGTKTGWALICNGLVMSGMLSFATNRTAGYGVRFLNFRNWLLEMLRKHGVDQVVFEDVRAHAGVFAAHVYGGFMAELASVCEELHVLYQGFGVKTIKKFITGSGNAGKQDIINALQNKGYRPIDDNEADALALLLLAESELTKENKTMNSGCKNKRTNIYSASLGLAGHEVKNRKRKYRANIPKMFTGPFEYSQIAGKYIAAFRYRQNFLQG
jgi:Holliday junction resolvasome RuvABC endonuclease subunit